MKSIKDIMNASNSLSIKAAKYIVSSCNNGKNYFTFLAEDESEITDAFYDWKLDESEVDFLSRKIQGLKPNQSYLHTREYNDWILITRIEFNGYYL